MAKKLLSPELAQVLKDIDNAREAINEKYALNGSPDPIPAPMISSEMADRIRAITVAEELPEQDGNVVLSVTDKLKTLPKGYYRDGIKAQLRDYVVGYVWNRQGLEAKRQHINIGEHFVIPDFLEGKNTVPEVPGEEFLGWSANWKADEPHYFPNMVVSNFEFERDLDTPEYIAYLYAVWRKLYTYTLTYSPNGGTGEPPMESYGPTAEEAHNFITNSSIIPVKETHRFIGWGETPDSKVSITSKTVTHLNPNAIVYALWELMALDNIELEFTYAHPEGDHGVITGGMEEVTMTVKGQNPGYPGLQRSFDCSGYKTVDQDTAKGATYYKHKFTFNEVGIYPVVVTHEAPSVDTKAANGIIKVMNTGGTMGGEGKFGGDRFDTDWISTNVMPGCTIKSYKFDLQIDTGHGNSYDQMYVLIKKTNGTIVRIRDVFNTDNVGTNPNNPVSETYSEPITSNGISNTYSDKIGNLSNTQWSLNGTLTKADDARQIRFIAITLNHAHCATDAIIDYNMDYDWDYDLYLRDKGGSGGGSPGESTPSTPSTPPAQGAIDLQLSNLVLTPGKLSPAFSSSVHRYTLTVGKTVNSVGATITVKDKRTNVTISDDNKNPINIRDSQGRIKSQFNITVSGDGSASTTGNGNYVINLAEEKSSNNYLSSLVPSTGTLAPAFNKNTTQYTMTVENNISSLQLNWTLEDSYASAVCSEGAGTIALQVGSNSITIRVTAEDGSTRTYTITITRKAASTPVTPPTPSAYYDISEVKDFTENWGYVEISGNKAMKELYARIYNCFMNNGEKPIQYTPIDGSAAITKDALFDYSAVGEAWKPYDKYLYVPVEDLGLTSGEIFYVHNIIEYDCPHILWQWKQRGARTCGSVGGKVMFHLMCHFDTATRNQYLSTMESTFQEICDLVNQHYGIQYVQDTFYNNNRRYTELEKKKIAKVIHDFIELNNHYGGTSMDATQPPWVDGIMLNQIAYPALSKGRYDPICASYAQAFKYCCDKWGISCICVAGHVNNEQDGNHAWNMVSYKQKTPKEIANTPSAWQEVDCTWDDMSNRSYYVNNPFTQYGITTQMLADVCIWDHFNVTTSELNSGVEGRGHTFEGIGTLGGGKGASRYKDYYESANFAVNGGSGLNSNGSQEIGVYKKYPNGTCSSNKYTGNTIYGGF